MTSETTPPSDAKKLLWDFFGPHAERTAQHFLVHLQQFLAQHQLPFFSAQLESAGAGHQAVACVLDAATQAAVTQSLRPNRVLEP